MFSGPTCKIRVCKVWEILLKSSYMFSLCLSGFPPGTAAQIHLGVVTWLTVPIVGLNNCLSLCVSSMIDGALFPAGLCGSVQ